MRVIVTALLSLMLLGSQVLAGPHWHRDAVTGEDQVVLRHFHHSMLAVATCTAADVSARSECGCRSERHDDSATYLPDLVGDAPNESNEISTGARANCDPVATLIRFQARRPERPLAREWASTALYLKKRALLC